MANGALRQPPDAFQLDRMQIKRSFERAARRYDEVAVLQPAAGMTAYVAGKAGVAAITQSLAVELVEDKILVNAVVPSIIDTPANRVAMPAANHASWPTPAQIAETIAFLASPANALTSGTLVPVYGAA